MGVIRRSIIHHDDFEIAVGLRKNAVDGLGEKLPVVVITNQNANDLRRWNEESSL